MMSVRTVALAGVAFFALSASAWADDPGWYLGLGAGYDHLTPVHMQTPPPPLGGQNDSVGYKDNAIGVIDGGYKFESGMRVELEFGYDQHGGSSLTAGSAASCCGPIFVGKFKPPTYLAGDATTPAVVHFP